MIQVSQGLHLIAFRHRGQKSSLLTDDRDLAFLSPSDNPSAWSSFYFGITCRPNGTDCGVVLQRQMFLRVAFLAGVTAVILAAETDLVRQGIADGGDVVPDHGNGNLTDESHGPTGTPPGPWSADLFYRALTNFTVREDVGTPACRIQTKTYVRHLMNNTYWAVKSEQSPYFTFRRSITFKLGEG